MNQPQQLSIFWYASYPRMSLKLNSKLRPNGENLLFILISIQGQRSTGHGRRSADAGSIPGGDYPATRGQANIT